MADAPLRPASESVPAPPVECAPGRSRGYWFLVPLVVFATIVAGWVVWWLFFAATYPPAPYPYFWPFFPFGFFLFFFALFFLWRWAWWGRGGYGRYETWENRDARSILQARYARGDIGREEFLRVSDDLAASERRVH